MARHEPTDDIRKVVENLSADGVPTQRIAAYVGIAKPTLFKYYSKEIQRAEVAKIQAVSQALFNKAVEGNVTAMCFFLKTRAYWRETNREEDEHGNAQEPINKIQIEVLQPGASKDAK